MLRPSRPTEEADLIDVYLNSILCQELQSQLTIGWSVDSLRLSDVMPDLGNRSVGRVAGSVLEFGWRLFGWFRLANLLTCNEHFTKFQTRVPTQIQNSHAGVVAQLLEIR